jgi:ABC-2 type transport system permease protein
MSSDLQKVAAIWRLNLRRAVGDRRVLFVAAALPIMLILVIGFVSGRDARAPIGVVVSDPGPIASRFLALLQESKSLQVHLESSVAAERDGVLRGTILSALVVPRGFDAAVRAGRPADLQVMARAGNTGAYVAQTAITGAFGVVSAEWSAARHLAVTEGTTPTVEFSKVASTTDAAYRAAVARFDSDQPGPYSYTTPANLVLFVFLTLLVMSSGMVESRRMGLLRRMLASPTRTSVVVLGELLSTAVLGVMQGLGLLVVGRLLFGVRWGDPVGVLLVVVVVSAAAAGASVLLGTVARSQEQAVALGIVVAVALGMLGGCTWPLSGVGPLMRAVGHVAPQAWAMDAFVRLVFGHSGIAGILPDVGVLAAFAVVLLTVATVRLRAVATAGDAMV